MKQTHAWQFFSCDRGHAEVTGAADPRGETRPSPPMPVSLRLPLWLGEHQPSGTSHSQVSSGRNGVAAS